MIHGPPSSPALRPSTFTMRLIIQPHREGSLARGDSRASQKSHPAPGSQEGRLGGLVEPWYGRRTLHFSPILFMFCERWIWSHQQAPLKSGPFTKRRQRSTEILTPQLSIELYCADNEWGTWGGLLSITLHTVWYNECHLDYQDPEEFKANLHLQCSHLVSQYPISHFSMSNH